jgi:hypothetical protein
MRRMRVCLLGVWSLKSVFKSRQIFQTQGLAHGFQIPLAYRLSWSLLVCIFNWPHSVGQNHFFVKMLVIMDFAIQKCSRRFCTVCKSENSASCQSSERHVIPSGSWAVQCINHLDDVTYHLDAHQTKASSIRTTWILVGTFLYSRSFELLQLAYVWTIQQPIRTAYDHHLDGAQFYQARCSFELLAYK